MHQFTGNFSVSVIKRYLPAFFCVVILGFLCSFIFFSHIWDSNNHLIHSAIEIFSISLMLFTFLNVWKSFSEADSLVKRIGFGALVVVFINLPHVMSFTDLLNVPRAVAGYLVDISLKHGVLIAYLEVFIWLLFSFYHKRYIVSKWIGLMISLVTALFLYVVLIKLIDFIPLFYNDLSITIVKHNADWVISLTAILVMFVYAANYRNLTEEREKAMYEHIIMALVFFMLSRMCFALSWNVTSPMHFLGHIFKLSHYYSIYSGVYKATIEYPYIQVRKVRDFFENILDTAPIGIITFDWEDRISYTNKQCDKFFRYNIKKIYGATMEQFLDSIVLHDCSKTELLDKLKNLQEGGIVFYGLPALSQNNSSKLIFTVMKLETGTSLVIRDAKKAQAIENMQLQTQTLLDSTDNIVLLIDISRKVVMCNKKFLGIINARMCDVIGTDIMELSNLVQFDGKYGTHIDICGGETTHGTKWGIRTVNGETKKISLDSSPIYDVDNEKIGWMIIGRDVSEYEKEQEKIIHREKMAIIGQMAAGLVHEIKNPLASIKGLCQLMMSRLKPEKTAEYAAVMESAVDDIGEIVNGFLQFSKPTTGDYSEVGINSMVKSLEMMISTNAYKRGVKTHFYYHDDEKPVIISSQQIKNAILGMVDNALDAMNGALDPTLIISTEYDKKGNMMGISIKDNGIGMTEEQLGFIGTPFYTTKPKGTGLGISVIKYIVNEHGGSLKIESRFGEGAVFKILLPCASEK